MWCNPFVWNNRMVSGAKSFACRRALASVVGMWLSLASRHNERANSILRVSLLLLSFNVWLLYSTCVCCVGCHELQSFTQFRITLLWSSWVHCNSALLSTSCGCQWCMIQATINKFETSQNCTCKTYSRIYCCSKRRSSSTPLLSPRDDRFLAKNCSEIT